MTVKELIEVLSKIEDQEVRVMVKGYEGGFCDVENINTEPIHMALDVNKEWYYGNHEPVDNMYDANSNNYQIVKAILI